ESFNIYVSTGSACNSEIAEPSHVLTACNADLDNYSPIRISLSKDNTEEEVEIFVQRLTNIISMLRKKSKMMRGK
ncbi:MAG: cysteine desulfurase NifS, partial [Bacilli bacterium]|nr:cysteine desulfurase NifS [Bacilli bacterium]